jgi:cytochrome c oxidase subunit 1
LRHHLFVANQSVLKLLIFSFLSFAVAVPSAIKVFNWTARCTSVNFIRHAILYSLGYQSLHHWRLDRNVCGFAGHGRAPERRMLVVAHFRYIAVGGTLRRHMGGCTTGARSSRMYPEGWGRFRRW